MSKGDQITHIKDTGEDYCLVERVDVKHIGGFDSNDDKFTLIIRKYHETKLSLEE